MYDGPQLHEGIDALLHLLSMHGTKMYKTAGRNPLAIDYHANRYSLLPLGASSAAAHDPDNTFRIVLVYRRAEASINAAGGVRRREVEGAHIELLSS